LIAGFAGIAGFRHVAKIMLGVARMSKLLATGVLSSGLAACTLFNAPFATLSTEGDRADASREDASHEDASYPDAPLASPIDAGVADANSPRAPTDAPVGDSEAGTLPPVSPPPDSGAAGAAAGEAGVACTLPPGNYRQSCDFAHCSEDTQCATLTCTCPNASGAPQTSSLNLSGCFDVANVAGTLACDCTLPPGSYHTTCRGCTVDPSCATLACSCQDQAGNWLPPSTVSAACAGQIDNVNGTLSCDPTTCPVAVVQNTYDTTYDGFITYTNTGMGAEVNPTVLFTLPAGATMYPDGCVWEDQTAPGCSSVVCTQTGTTVTYAFTGSLAPGAQLQLYYSTDQSTEPPATNIVVTTASACL
jgi:CVNH domain